MILVLKGFCAVVIQSLFLREILSAFWGNELSVAAVIGFWLLGGAAGAFFYRGRERFRNGEYLGLTLLENILVVGGILLVRMSRGFLGVLPGIPLGPVCFLILCMASCFLPGMLEGVRFLVVSGLYRKEKGAGKMYALEGLGALAGGIAFMAGLLLRISPLSLIALAGAVNLAAGLVRAERQTMALATVAAWLVLGTGAGTVEEISQRIRWKPFLVLEAGYGVHGNTTVLSGGGQVLLVRDGKPALTSQPDFRSVKNQAFFSLAFCPEPRNVLLVHAGQALPEFLGYGIRRIAVFEEDPAQAGFLKQYVLDSGAFAVAHGRYPQIEFLQGDAYSFLLQKHRTWDVILLGGDIPSSLRENRLYTTETAEALAARLTPGGVLAVALPGSSDYMGGALLRAHACVFKTFSGVFRFRRVALESPVLYLFSNGNPLAGFPKTDAPDKDLFNPSYVRLSLDRMRAERLEQALLGSVSVRKNMHDFPSLVYEGLAVWMARISPGAGRIAARGVELLLPLRDARPALLVLFFCLFLLPCGRTALSGRIAFANGLIALCLEVLLLFVFQIRVGYLFFFIALLVACFMGGLSMGGFLSAAATPLGTKTGLLVPESVYLLFLISCAGGTAVPMGIHPVSIGVCLLAGGFLTGWEFGILTRDSQRLGKGLLGKLYALDLLGAAAAAVLVTQAMPAVFGISGSFLFLATLKLATLIGVLRLALWRL